MLECSPRFYGRRKGRRLRPTARKALDQAFECLLFNPEELAFLSPDGPQAVWLEIGFGGGEHFLEQLQRNPDVHLLGCEAYENGVANLAKTLKREDYARVRLFPQDIRLCLPEIPAETFSRIFILFPDPWSKKRHHKRRLLQPAFLKELARTLQPGGQIRISSDDLPYIEWVEALFEGDASFSPLYAYNANTVAFWPKDWPRTRYGNKALQQKKSCFFRIYQKGVNSSRIKVI